MTTFNSERMGLDRNGNSLCSGEGPVRMRKIVNVVCIGSCPSQQTPWSNRQEYLRDGRDGKSGGELHVIGEKGRVVGG